MATAGGWLVFAVRLVNLAPLVGLQIEAPHVVELLVIILLTTEDVHLLVVDASRNGSALSWAAHSLFFTGQQIGGTVGTFMLEFDNVVNTGSINVTAKSEKGSVFEITNCEVVSSDVLNWRLDAQARPLVFEQIKKSNLGVAGFALKAAKESNFLC